MQSSASHPCSVIDYRLMLSVLVNLLANDSAKLLALLERMQFFKPYYVHVEAHRVKGTPSLGHWRHFRQACWMTAAHDI